MPEKCITFCFKFNSKEESSGTSDENNSEDSKITGNISYLTFKQNLSLLLKPTIITILHGYNYINFSDTYIPSIVSSHEDKEDLETSNQNVKDVNREHDEHNGKELELMVSVLVATVLEKMNLFMLQRCCNACLSIASTNIICKCESTAYSVSSLINKAL